MVEGKKLVGYKSRDEVVKRFKIYPYELYTLDIEKNKSKEVEIGKGVVLRIYRLGNGEFKLKLQGKYKTLEIPLNLRKDKVVVVELPNMFTYGNESNLARHDRITDAYGYKKLLGYPVSPFELYLDEMGRVVLKVYRSGLEYPRKNRENYLIFLPIIVGGTFLLFYATNLSGFSVKLQSNFQILFIIFSLFFVFASIFLLFLSRGSKKYR
jgi:hypothetical protein